MHFHLFSIATFFSLAVSFFIVSSQARATVICSWDKSDRKDADKTAIVYVTRTGNTKTVARIIKQQVGGDLIELRLEEPYPENYQGHVDQVSRENKEDYLPRLANDLSVFSLYDRIFLGYPTWNMTLPPPVKTFLTEVDLQGKSLIPFNTNAGFGTGDSLRVISKLCRQCEVHQSLVLEGGYEREGIFFAIKGRRLTETKKVVSAWLDRLGYLKVSKVVG